MKKFLFLFYFLAISILSYSQYYLGLTEGEAINKIMYEENINDVYISNSTPSKTTVYTWKNINGQYTYDLFFNKDSIAEYYRVTPTNKENMNSYIAVLNKTYVIVSDKEWKAYLSGNIFKIALVYNYQRKTYYFYFSLIK